MLAIQKYIKENGFDKAVNVFQLKTREYENKILMKYDQLVSPTIMANIEVQECRGLILEKGTWNVMSLAFTKFFNSEEGNAAKIDWNTAHVLEKLDGCCHEDTILITEDGEMTIREICETEYSGKVLSFDLETNEPVYDEIVEYSVKKNINNWFEIELEDGTTVKLTGNHKVWLPNLECYRRVDELTEDDEFLLIT
jgi:ribosomal protein S8